MPPNPPNGTRDLVLRVLGAVIVAGIVGVVSSVLMLNRHASDTAIHQTAVAKRERVLEIVELQLAVTRQEAVIEGLTEEIRELKLDVKEILRRLPQ